jgi:hypothetical protein
MGTAEEWGREEIEQAGELLYLGFGPITSAFSVVNKASLFGFQYFSGAD